MDLLQFMEGVFDTNNTKFVRIWISKLDQKILPEIEALKILNESLRLI